MREQDLCRRRFALLLAELGRTVTRLQEAVDERAQVVLEHVVAQVDDELVLAEKIVRDEHAVRQPEGRVLLDVRHLDAEQRSVADGGLDLGPGLADGDDDADVLDSGGGELLDAVEDDRLVRDRHELLRARVGDRTQAGAGAAGEDQALHPRKK